MLRIRFSLAVLGAMLALGAAPSDAEARHCDSGVISVINSAGISRQPLPSRTLQYGNACCSTGCSDWNGGNHMEHSGHQSGCHMMAATTRAGTIHPDTRIQTANCQQ